MGGGGEDKCPTRTPELYVKPIIEGEEMCTVGVNVGEVKCLNVTLRSGREKR